MSAATPEYHLPNRTGLPLEAPAPDTVSSSTESDAALYNKHTRHDPAFFPLHRALLQIHSLLLLHLTQYRKFQYHYSRSPGSPTYLDSPCSTDPSLYSFFVEPLTVALVATCTTSLSARQTAKVYFSTQLPYRPCHSFRARARSLRILKFCNLHTK